TKESGSGPQIRAPRQPMVLSETDLGEARRWTTQTRIVALADLLVDVLQGRAAQIVAHRSPGAPRVDVGRSAFFQHVVHVHCAEVDAEPGAAGLVRHRGMQ